MLLTAASHIHSSWSYDGTKPLSELSAKFVKRGCRVLMMTEHDRGFTNTRFQQFREECAAASTNEILVVPGIEYSDAENCVHVLVWGLDTFLAESMPTEEMLEAVKAAGGVAVLAHPTRKSAWSVIHPRWLTLLLGIEAWNRKYDGWAPSKTSPALLDATLNAHSCMPFVGLDYHSDKQLFPLTMELDVEGDITEASVIRSLKQRRCRACAFGRLLDSRVLRVSETALRLAERSRRTAASAVRSAKALVSA